MYVRQWPDRLGDSYLGCLLLSTFASAAATSSLPSAPQERSGWVREGPPGAAPDQPRSRALNQAGGGASPTRRTPAEDGRGPGPRRIRRPLAGGGAVRINSLTRWVLPFSYISLYLGI